MLFYMEKCNTCVEVKAACYLFDCTVGEEDVGSAEPALVHQSSTRKARADIASWSASCSCKVRNSAQCDLLPCGGFAQYL